MAGKGTLLREPRVGRTTWVGVYVKHTIAKDLEAYIGGLQIPQGRFMGQPFALFPWQRRFLRGAFAQPDDAALTVSRGAGKTTFIAAIAAACVDGPLAEPNAESLIIASSFDQGLICWRHVLRLLATGPGPRRRGRQGAFQDSGFREPGNAHGHPDGRNAQGDGLRSQTPTRGSAAAADWRRTGAMAAGAN